MTLIRYTCRCSFSAVFLKESEKQVGVEISLTPQPTFGVILKERERELGGGSLPLASAAYGVFRYPLCGALPRNAPKDSGEIVIRV
jgi:hypothetical protein